MKRTLLLFLFVLSTAFIFSKPTAANAGICTCSDGHTETTEQDGCCLECANYARREFKEIDRASKWKERANSISEETLSCGEIHFCWCADRTDSNKCFIAGRDNSVATTASCETICADTSPNYSSIMRWFDSNYVDRRGTDSTNICGEYCWCNKPAADTGTETTCELRRVSTKTVQGSPRPVPLRGDAECRATCEGLRSAGGTRRGTFGLLEQTYTNRSGRADCSQAGTATGGTRAPAAAPAGPIRLFNPMAGASTIVDIINRVINMIMGTVGAGALLMFVYGGIKWMTAGGDSKNVADAQMILKNATLGILLLMFSYTIIATFFSLLR